MYLLVFLHTFSESLQFSAVGHLWLVVASAAPVLTPHSCILKPQKPLKSMLFMSVQQPRVAWSGLSW